jgi:hypothetical protein
MKQSDIDVVGSILMSMSDVQESTIHGYRSFKTRGKLLACLAVHKSVEPNSLVVKLPAEERDRLLAEQPRTYYVTDHYARNAVVLVRLSEIDGNSLRSLLERACRLLNQDRRNRGAIPRGSILALDSTPKKSPTSRSTRARVKRA